MCIAVFRSVGTVAPRALSGLTGTPAAMLVKTSEKFERLRLSRFEKNRKIQKIFF